jgi:hypothetical protein
MTDDELESYIAAIDRYLSRHGVDTTSRRAAIRAERAAALTLNQETLTFCWWCEGPFWARRAGAAQRFCCAAHRKTAFWTALRRWGQRAVCRWRGVSIRSGGRSENVHASLRGLFARHRKR